MMEKEIKLEEIEKDEILEGFAGEGISVDTIGKHLYRSGLLVKLIIGRMRLKYEYDFKALGIDFNETSSKDFAKGHMQNGKISILPMYLEKKLTSIEGSLRNRQKRMATGFEGQFMPLDSYTEFKADFENTRKEYFAVRDEILNNWDTLIEDYKKRLEVLLQDVNAIEKEVVYDKMIGMIPGKEAYANSFKMMLSVKTMPQVSEDEGLHDEINEVIAKDIVSVVHETVAGCLEKAFSLANSAAKGYREGEIGIRTVGAIRTISTTLRNRNVVANNPIIEEVALLFDEAAASEDRDEMASVAEIIMAKTYCYAKKNSLPLPKQTVISEEDLERINQYA